MNTMVKDRSPVSRQVQACEETWQRDHDALQECWASEDTLAVGTSTGLLLERVESAWRDRVFREAESHSDEASETYFRLFTVWLRVTEAVLARVVESRVAVPAG